MAHDHSGSAAPSPEDRKAADRAGRKRLGENGFPQTQPTHAQQDAANRTKMTVTRAPVPHARPVGGQGGKA